MSCSQPDPVGSSCNDSDCLPDLLASCAWPVWLLLLPTNFCSHNKQRRVSAPQIPTQDEGDSPEGVRSAQAAGTAWTLPILPSLLSPGVWTYPAHRLLTHIRLGLLEADTPRETPSTLTGKGLRVIWLGSERGPAAPPGAPVVTFLLLWAKGQRPLGGGGGLIQC